MSKSNMQKIAVAAGLFGMATFAGTAYAVSYEHPYIHKDPRALGMGGAAMAIGGQNSALFYNPAGLGRMDRGFTVDLLPGQAGWGNNTRDFLDELDATSDIEDDDEQTDAVLEVLRDYRGEHMHMGAASFPALGWRGETVAVSFGYLASGSLDMRSHQGYGSEGLLEVDGRVLFGPVAGVAYQTGNLTFGATVKSLSMERVDRTYSARELTELTDNDFDLDDDKIEGSAVGFDLGLLYDFAPGHSLQPTLGVSLQNIGDMDFGEAGKLPMTVNLGLAMQPKGIRGLVAGIDYVDLLNQYEDSDILKRVRLGAEYTAWNNWSSSLALRAGLYQGEYTWGAEMRLTVVTIGYATYAEQVGAYAGQDSDRRHMLNASIGW